MKNPFWKISSILIILALFLSILTSIYFMIILCEEYPDISSVWMLLITLMVKLILIRYLYRLNKVFKNKLLLLLKNHPEPIATFNYSDFEWRSFAEKYIIKKRKDMLIENGIYVAIFSVIIYFILNGVNSATANNIDFAKILGTSIFTILSVFVLKYYYSLEQFRRGMLNYKQPKTIITGNGVLINDTKIISYNNQDNLLSSYCYVVFLERNCIEISVQSGNGKHKTKKLHYILIPKEVESKSESIIEGLNMYIYRI